MVTFPPAVDPCGERGEFHSFVYDGPMFSDPIALEAGEIVNRDGFIYADYMPAGIGISGLQVPALF